MHVDTIGVPGPSLRAYGYQIGVQHISQVCGGVQVDSFSVWPWNEIATGCSKSTWGCLEFTFVKKEYRGLHEVHAGTTTALGGDYFRAGTTKVQGASMVWVSNKDAASGLRVCKYNKSVGGLGALSVLWVQKNGRGRLVLEAEKGKEKDCFTLLRPPPPLGPSKNSAGQSFNLVKGQHFWARYTNPWISEPPPPHLKQSWAGGAEVCQFIFRAQHVVAVWVSNNSAWGCIACVQIL